MPAQDRGGCDQPMREELAGERFGSEGAEHGSEVAEFNRGLALPPSQHRDLVAQDEKLGVLGCRGSSSASHVLRSPDQDQFSSRSDTGHDHARRPHRICIRRSQSGGRLLAPHRPSGRSASSATFLPIRSLGMPSSVPGCMCPGAGLVTGNAAAPHPAPGPCHGRARSLHRNRSISPRAHQRAGPPASPGDPPPADPGLIPLTAAGIKRVFNLVTRTWQTIRHCLHWSWWRRRHQARARWFHQRARLRTNAADP